MARRGRDSACIAAPGEKLAAEMFPAKLPTHAGRAQKSCMIQPVRNSFGVDSLLAAFSGTLPGTGEAGASRPFSSGDLTTRPSHASPGSFDPEASPKGTHTKVRHVRL
jgi:hypothetical protein